MKKSKHNNMFRHLRAPWKSDKTSETPAADAQGIPPEVQALMALSQRLSTVGEKPIDEERDVWQRCWHKLGLILERYLDALLKTPEEVAAPSGKDPKCHPVVEFLLKAIVAGRLPMPDFTQAEKESDPYDGPPIEFINLAGLDPNAV